MHVGLLELILTQSASFIILAALLLAAGVINASETVLFSLTHYDRLQLRGRSARAAEFIEYILRQPERLLLAIMVANMAVNSLIFAISSVVVYRFAAAHHSIFAGAVGVATLLALVLFADIFSKAAIYYLRVPVSAVVAAPVYYFLRTLRVPLAVMEKVFITPLVRLIIGPAREHRVAKSELLTLFDIAGQDRYLQPAQVDLLKKAAELRDLRVRQVMTPRVAMPCCEVHQSPESVRALVAQNHRPYFAVYVYQIDYIVGIVQSRRLLLEEPRRIKDILERVKFVPETQRVDQLLRFFHTENIEVALVVDEYGGLLGMVSLDDLMERTIGEMTAEFPDPEAPKLLAVRPGEYLVDGHYPLADLLDQLKVPRPDVDVDTLAGLVMHLVGHLPGQGERIVYDDLELVVDEIDSNRIGKVHVMDRRKRHG